MSIKSVLGWTATMLVGGTVVVLFNLPDETPEQRAKRESQPEYIQEQQSIAMDRAIANGKALEEARSNATTAMRNSPTAANIAQWETANRAVYGPEWKGSWREDIAQDQAFWANSYASSQAEQLREDLRDRPVIVVVANP